MAIRPQGEKDKLEPSDYETRYVNGEEVIYYKDGSSTRVCGGPCAPMNYDEYGEEI